MGVFESDADWRGCMLWCLSEGCGEDVIYLQAIDQIDIEDFEESLVLLSMEW